MEQNLAIRLSHSIQELLHASTYVDQDNFGLRLSRALAFRISAGEDPSSAIDGALSEIKTTFFRRNRLKRHAFGQHLSSLVGIREIGMPEALHFQLTRFCAFAESQLAGELWNSRNDEGVLRSHLQTFLQGTGHRTLKEVSAGRGRADIALLDEEASGLIEVKLWKGNAYFQDGLIELSEYMRTERLHSGHYVVRDCSGSNDLVRINGKTWAESVGGRTIRVWFIQVSEDAPSRLGRSRRRSQR